jgi:hypothetical protein
MSWAASLSKSFLTRLRTKRGYWAIVLVAGIATLFLSWAIFTSKETKIRPPEWLPLILAPPQPANPINWRTRKVSLVPSTSESNFCKLVKKTRLDEKYPLLYNVSSPGCMVDPGKQFDMVSQPQNVEGTVTSDQLKSVLLRGTHQFERCAVVGASAILSQRPRGHDIDDHDAVFRINYAPGGEYPVFPDLYNTTTVGSYTTVQVLGRTWHLEVYSDPHADEVVEFFAKRGGVDVVDTLKYSRKYIMRSHSAVLMYKDPVGMEGPFVDDLLSLYPQKWIAPWKEDLSASLIYLADTAFQMNGHGMSTGFLSVFFALRHCANVDLYGFYPFCRDLNGDILGYNYYDRTTYSPTKTGYDCPPGFSYYNYGHRLSLEYDVFLELLKRGVLRIIV